MGSLVCIANIFKVVWCYFFECINLECYVLPTKLRIIEGSIGLRLNENCDDDK